VVQRCGVHKPAGNLERRAPKHVLELRADFHRIVYVATVEAARAVWAAFERAWRKRCPGWSRAPGKGARSCDLLQLSEGPVEDAPHHQQHQQSSG
jgi:transposase-like protein